MHVTLTLTLTLTLILTLILTLPLTLTLTLTLTLIYSGHLHWVLRRSPHTVVRVYVSRRGTNDVLYIHLILTRNSRHRPWLVVY